jgi:hypothetical protein
MFAGVLSEVCSDGTIRRMRAEGLQAAQIEV